MSHSHPKNDKSILLAYFIPTLIWFIITNNDFIAYSQQTIADSRRLGRVHLVLISIPAMYLSYFINVQVRIKDYKIMSLAVIAFIFTMLHLCRTFYGLWQLQVFKQWLITSLIKMESLGYRARLPTKRHTRGDAEMPSRTRRPAETSVQVRTRLDRYTDNILVKENLIDGIRNSRSVSCDFHLFSRQQVAEIRACETMLGGVASCVSHSVKSILKIPALLYSLVFEDTPNYLYINQTPFFLPQDPEKLFVRWACTLASQLPNWVEDMHNSGPMTESRRRSIRRRARNNANTEFRGFPPWLLSVHNARLLLEANPHLPFLRWAFPPDFDAEPEPEVADDAETEAEERRRRESSDCSRHRTVPFKQWMKHPGFFRCMSCKQKHLKTVFGSGDGLPYGMPHNNARKWEGDDAPFGYDQFRMELDRAKGMLPMEVEEKVLHFGVRELEWLAVFLGI